MSEHRYDTGRELTDQELALIQGGGVWDKVQGAGRWLSDKMTEAGDYISKLRQRRSVDAIVTVLNAIYKRLGEPTDRRNPGEVIH